METFLIKALQLILSLSILVVVHEFGHYIFARMFKIRVEKFYLFFDAGFALLDINLRIVIPNMEWAGCRLVDM